MPDERELTPEQRAAIEVDGSAVVRAGAGCGKTAVLALRFVHLLTPPPAGGAPPVDDVGQILAITFTEKAAAEMKRKIRDVVAATAAAAPEPARPRWAKVQRDLLGAHISTIHAFCARVLRENPLEAAVDPRAVVLDEHETRTWMEAVVESALLARLRAGEQGARELVLRSGLAGGRTGGAVGLCADFLARLARTGRDSRWLAAARTRQEDGSAAVAESLRASAARLVALVEAGIARGGKGKGVQRLGEAWPRWKEMLAGVGPGTTLDEFLTLRVLRDLLAGAKLAGDVKDELAVQDGRVHGALAEAYGYLAALPENARLSELLGGIAETVRARKREDAVLTFDDLITETRAVLTTHAAVRDRYGRRFRAILVDEFQDTDRVQADVIRLLAAASPPPLLFVVGDEKQSIYRFRGADVAVFQAVGREIGEERSLGTNFRSVPGILRFVNALAAAILRLPPGGDPAHWTRFDDAQRLVPRRTDGEGAPAVRLVSFVEEHAARELAVAEARELEARVLAGVVERLHDEDRVRYGDIAVLFRAFTEVKTYENALRRREIPYYVVKGRGFFQCQEVTDVVSLLAAVVDPADEIALASALRSPLFAVDDDTLWRLAWPPDRDRPALGRRFRREESFADLADLPDAVARLSRVRDLLLRLRRLASRATVAELLGEVCAATDFEAVCLAQFQGTRKVANVRKLIELARDWERKRFFSLRDFVRTVRRLAETEPREAEAPLVGEEDDVVRLMTVHQAKGLEFPAVIVPDLGRALKPDNRIPALDDELGVVGGPLDPSGWVAVAHAGLEAHRARERDLDRAEHARLFYVACTRAKDILVLLEGKGDGRYLRDGKGDGFPWCHQVWDVLGRERTAAFIASGEPERLIELADGGAVRVERAGRYLASAAGEPAVPAPRVAAAGAAERQHVARVLDFTPAAPAEVITSPTALADFGRCPRQYWYRHVVGLPERGAGGLRATVLGTAAHGVLEELAFDPVPEDAIRRHVDARPEALVLRRRERDALAADLTVALAALRADVAGGLEITGREVPFVLGLPRGAPRVFLHGRIDLLCRRGERHLIRDYKYARPGPGSVEHHAPQLAPYRLAVIAARGTPADAELVFVRGGTVVRRLPSFDAGAEEATLVRAGIALGERLAAGTIDDFPRTPEAPARCEALGCGYVRRCWGAAALTRTASGPRSCTVAS